MVKSSSSKILYQVLLELKDPNLEPSRILRQTIYQMCYYGFCQLEDFIHYLVSKKGVKMCETKEFTDFIHVMEAFNYKYSGVNYLKMVRNTYVRKPILIMMTTFKRSRDLNQFDKTPEGLERAAQWIQLGYRNYRKRQGEQKLKIQSISQLNAQDLVKLLTKKIMKAKKSMKEIFEIFDEDQDGQITFDEFQRAFDKSKILVAPEILRTVFNYFDINQNNSIQYMEFLSKVVIDEQPSTLSFFQIQLKVDSILTSVRGIMQREYSDFEKCFNAVSAYDRLKLGVEDFVDFIAMHTTKFSQIQLEHLFNFLDKGNKGYLKIEEFSRIYMVTNEDIDNMAKVEDGDRSDVNNKHQKEDDNQQQINDAKYLYRFIQAENLKDFIEQQNEELLNLFQQTPSKQNEMKRVRFNEETQNRIDIFKNQVLKLEIFFQQISLYCLSKCKSVGITLKQLFSQFSQKFPEKFMEVKEFVILLNYTTGRSMNEELIKSVFRLFSNNLTRRLSLAKFLELIELGASVSPVQLRIRNNYGQIIDKLRPKLLEQFQSAAVTNDDMQFLPLKRTLEILNNTGIKLEMFEIQRLVDEGIVQVQERRYMVQYEKLIEKLFPSYFVIEEVIRQKYAWVLYRAWKRMKTNYFEKKQQKKLAGNNKKKSKLLSEKQKPQRKSLQAKLNNQLPPVREKGPYETKKFIDLSKFANVIINEIIEGAVYYAESQMFTTNNQSRYLQRGVERDVFIIQPCCNLELPNILANSLSFDSQTQRIYLTDKTSNLFTFDFTGNKLLPNVNIGSRIPFNRTFIVDALIYQSKLFLLKSNWQLQSWSLTQRQDFPIRTLTFKAFSPATSSDKYIFNTSQYLLVINPSRQQVFIISQVSLHIISIVELSGSLRHHNKSLQATVSKAIRVIMQKVNEKYRFKMNQKLDIEKQRKQALEFETVFKQIEIKDMEQCISKSQVIKYLTTEGEITQSDEIDYIEAYMEVFCQGKTHVTKKQFKRLFKNKKLQDKKEVRETKADSFEVKQVARILIQKIENPRQVFSSYDKRKTEELNSSEIEQLLKDYEIDKDLQKKFLKGIVSLSYEQFQKLLQEQHVHISFSNVNFLCQKKNIDLEERFKKADPFSIGLVDRMQFDRILLDLPFGILQEEIEWIALNEAEYDSESGKIRWVSLFRTPEMQDQNIKSIAYIEDLDILLYSTNNPKTSSIFVSKIEKSQIGKEYLLGVMRGHREPHPPMLYYCDYSGCLLSGDQYGSMCVWNIYRDLTVKFDINPPWNHNFLLVSPLYQFQCHQGSVNSIMYLPNSQLIVTAGADQQIRFWDPLDSSIQNSKQLVKVKPGYYNQQNDEEEEEHIKGKKFKEVKSVPIQCSNLSCGFLATSFSDESGDGTKMIQVEFLLCCSNSGAVQCLSIHRQPITVPFIIKSNLPKSVIQKMESEMKNIVEQAMRGKRSKVITVTKEIHREIVKEQVNRTLIKLAKQLLYSQNREQIEEKIIKEVNSACKMNQSQGFDLSFIFNLLRSCKCLNPQNVSFEEFKKLMIEGEIYNEEASKNRIEQKLRELIREGQIDLDYQFEKFQNGFLEKCLTRHQFKKMLIKNGAFSNEYDLDDLLKRLGYGEDVEGVQLLKLKVLFENDYLINQLRMVARPNLVVDEIKQIISQIDGKKLMNKLALCDKNSDGILEQTEYVNALIECQVEEAKMPLFKEFFNLYSFKYQDTNVIKLQFLLKKLFKEEENILLQMVFYILGKIRNTLIYRSLNFDFLFKEEGSTFQFVAKEDFIQRTIQLNITDVSEKEIFQVADFLAFDDGLISFQSFTHYVNKIHSSDQFLLINDYEQLLKGCNVILSVKERLRQMFNNKSLPFQEYRVILHEIGLGFEQIDKMIIKVFHLRTLAFEQFIDLTVNFVNQVDFTIHKEKQSELGSLLLDDQQQQSEQFKYIVKLGSLLRENMKDIISKLYEQCIEFDSDKNGFIELPVFSNIIAYNIPNIQSELLLTFQFQWKTLTNEKNIDYRRFFREYVMFEYNSDSQQSKDSQGFNINLIVKNLSQMVNDCQMNLGFALKKFYNYDNKNIISKQQLSNLLEQIALKLTTLEMEGLSEYLGMNQENDFMAKHQKILEIYHFGSLNVQVSYENDIWMLAGQQISLTTLQKLQRNSQFIYTQLQAYAQQEQMFSNKLIYIFLENPKFTGLQ